MQFFITRLILLVLFGVSSAVAQKKLPVVKANSRSAYIMEGADRYGWGINPKEKPDVHLLTKHPAPLEVGFYTDSDSLKITMRPGETFDFIVLLNNRDTCYTRLQSPKTINYAKLPVKRDTIPFTFTSFNNIKIKGVLNNQDTLYLNFDTGTTGLLLTNDAIKAKTHLTGEPEQTKNTLRLGNLTWDNLPVYPVVLSGQETDGRFGWDLFDGRIVEMDYEKNQLIIHTRLPKIPAGYAKLPVEYSRTLFYINGEMEIKGVRSTNRFMFDSGYQRTIMLDTVLMNEQNYPRELDVIKKVIMKNGQGKEIPVYTINNDQLKLGNTVLKDIPAQLLATANPAGFKTHILGSEVLKRFNAFLDFQNNVVYLKPNKLSTLPYVDAKKP